VDDERVPRVSQDVALSLGPHLVPDCVRCGETDGEREREREREKEKREREKTEGDRGREG